MGALLKRKRIGILAGTFDPVHKGHIAFALQAIRDTGLDGVVFMPEPRPRHKHDVTHLAHRIAMLKIAINAHPKLSVLELPDKQFTVKSSLPRIKHKFPNDELLMLIGSDVLAHISVWPNVGSLLKNVGLIVAVRGQVDERHALQLLSQLPVEPKENHVIIGQYSHTASRKIRTALKNNETSNDVLGSVQKYSKEHWLYTSVAGSASKS